MPSTNQANAQHSTGPKTEAGKRRSSLNAFRHGLTGQTIFMPGDDISAYQAFCKRAFDELKPQGLLEEIAVQAIADSQLRLSRGRAYELNLYALDAATDGRDVTKMLANLSIYELRLNRTLEKATQTLAELQRVRLLAEAEVLKDAKNLLKYYNSKKIAWNPSDDGFVFTCSELAAAIRRDEHSKAAGRYAYSEYEPAA